VAATHDGCKRYLTLSASVSRFLDQRTKTDTRSTSSSHGPICPSRRSIYVHVTNIRIIGLFCSSSDCHDPLYDSSMLARGRGRTSTVTSSDKTCSKVTSAIYQTTYILCRPTFCRTSMTALYRRCSTSTHRGGSYVDVINRPPRGLTATVPLPSEEPACSSVATARRAVMPIDVLGLTSLGVSSSCTPVSRTSTGKTRSAAAATIRRGCAPTCLQYCAMRRQHRSQLARRYRLCHAPDCQELT